MKLGAGKKVKAAELLDAMGVDEPEPEPEAAPEPAPAATAVAAAPTTSAPPPGIIPAGRGSLPPVAKQPCVPRCFGNVMLRGRMQDPRRDPRDALALAHARGRAARTRAARRAQPARRERGRGQGQAHAQAAVERGAAAVQAAPERRQVRARRRARARAQGPLQVRSVVVRCGVLIVRRSFPVGQPLGVLKWRWAEKDEGVVPLSSASVFASWRIC